MTNDARANGWIVDAHCHFGAFGVQSLGGRHVAPLTGHELADFQHVFDYIDRYGLACVVLLPIYAPDPAHAFLLNTAVVQCAHASNGRVIPGLWVDPSPAMREHLARTLALAKTSDVHVLKTSADVWAGVVTPDPSTWSVDVRKGMSDIIDYASGSKCLLQIHTGSGRSDIKEIERLFLWAPRNISFQLVHMGNGVRGHCYVLSRLTEWIAEGVSVYCDTSLARGFAVRWMTREIRAAPLLADRFLFASDEPWGICQSELAAILEATEHCSETRAAVLGGNARKLFTRLGVLK